MIHLYAPPLLFCRVFHVSGTRKKEASGAYTRNCTVRGAATRSGGSLRTVQLHLVTCDMSHDSCLSRRLDSLIFCPTGGGDDSTPPATVHIEHHHIRVF